jgi:mxaJ protein
MRCALLFVALLAAVGAACSTGQARTRAAALVVCADPNNLPFSNDRLEGFENRLAEMIGADLGVPVRYAWMPERRGFVRNTLKSGRCNVIMGVPAGFALARPTIPYYRSTYVFVYRKDRGLKLHSLDDPTLRKLKIGVHVIGADYASLPPVAALARRHIIQNVVGFSIYGDYAQPNPPARLIDAVARGDIDVAIAWGPRTSTACASAGTSTPSIDRGIPFRPRGRSRSYPDRSVPAGRPHARADSATARHRCGSQLRATASSRPAAVR